MGFFGMLDKRIVLLFMAWSAVFRTNVGFSVVCIACLNKK